MVEEGQIPPLIRALFFEYGERYSQLIKKFPELTRYTVVKLLTDEENPFSDTSRDYVIEWRLRRQHLQQSYETLRQIAKDITPLASQYKPELLQDANATLEKIVDVLIVYP